MFKYEWPCWWGGTAQADERPQIATKVPELRKLVGGLEARKVAGGPRFAIKSAKDLMDKLRDALDALEMVDFPVNLVGGNVPLGVDEDGAALEGTLAFLMATIRIGAPDGSYIDIVGAGHGADQQDKAGGKASTYAWKDAHIKGLDLPDSDMVDTDDEEKPIKKGLRQKAPVKAAAVARPKVPTADEVRAAIEAATTADELKAAGALGRSLPPDQQGAVSEAYKAKKAELA
ncbi:MAG: hypothetical protein H0U84_05875 [Thermoleophilaceae bacterium]|nr:hypothetical protein [Thermoleophilaceae bacterium]